MVLFPFPPNYKGLLAADNLGSLGPWDSQEQIFSAALSVTTNTYIHTYTHMDIYTREFRISSVYLGKH